MSLTSRLFYQVLGIAVSKSPATGYNFVTGFNNVFTGGNVGANQIQQLQRVQSVTDGWTLSRTNINQLGQLSILSREIVTAPEVNLGGSYYVADLSNERVLGLNVSGDYLAGNNAALSNILNKTQAEKNYFIAVAPPGQDLIGWTGQSQVIQVTNGFLASWSTEGSVGNIPTTTFSVQGYNWATSTGSFNQQLQAIDASQGTTITGVFYTLPQFTTGIATVSALRPIDSTVSIGNAALGLDITDVKMQSYNIGFDLNLEGLQQLGARFPYSREIKFPVTLNATVSAYFGNLVTGSLNTVLCNDVPYTVLITLNDPCSSSAAVTYALKGMKVDSIEYGSQDIGAIAAVATIKLSSTIGGPNDSTNNLFLSGRNI